MIFDLFKRNSFIQKKEIYRILMGVIMSQISIHQTQKDTKVTPVLADRSAGGRSEWGKFETKNGNSPG